MAHEVRMEANISNILSKDVEFSVKGDGSVIGDLWVSKGGIEWRHHKKSVNTVKMSWEKFDELMEGCRQVGVSSAIKILKKAP